MLLYVELVVSYIVSYISYLHLILVTRHKLSPSRASEIVYIQNTIVVVTYYYYVSYNNYDFANYSPDCPIGFSDTFYCFVIFLYA